MITNLQQEFDSVGPWVTRFWVDGVPCGGSTYDPRNDPRLDMFDEISGPLTGKRILELGPLEGGHTIQLARRGASVVGIEGHETSYQRCLFVKKFFQLDNVEFVLGDLRSVDLKALGSFDLIFNVGVLYHLDEPWDLLARLRGAAKRMFLSTHCAAPDQSNVTVDFDGLQLQGSWWQEGPLEDTLSGLQPRSFWPTRDFLEKMLVRTGWPLITWMDYDPEATNGPLACLWVDQPRGLKRLLPFNKSWSPSPRGQPRISRPANER